MHYSIVYHDPCFDGLTAAWVIIKTLEKEAPDNTTVVLYPSKYGDPVPEFEPTTTLYIVDFSYPRDAMIALKDKVHDIVVLDHHKTAQANCEGLGFCKFDMNSSGAAMTWDYFHPGEPRPKLVNYVEDRDLWRWALVHSHAINAYISSFDKKFKSWDELAYDLDETFDDCVRAGTHILRYDQQKVKEIAEEVRWTTLQGHDIPVVNTPYMFASEVGNLLLKQYPNAPFAATYFDRADGKQQWSLRSNGFDVSEVAKQEGGGGHQRAAGFVKGE